MKLPVNATFHCFKKSGKWYTSGRGHLPKKVFETLFKPAERRYAIVEANGGKYPGLGNTGLDEFIFVVIGDGDYDYPLMLFPE